MYDRLIHQTTEVELEPEPGHRVGVRRRPDVRDDAARRRHVLRRRRRSTPTPSSANIERAKTVEGTGVAAYLARVDTVEVVDPTHVRVHAQQARRHAAQPAGHAPGDDDEPGGDVANTDLDTNPVGSGPYTLVEYRDSEVAIYERNPDYWDPDFVGPAGLEIYYFPDANTRLNALRTGQVDAAPSASS